MWFPHSYWYSIFSYCYDETVPSVIKEESNYYQENETTDLRITSDAANQTDNEKNSGILNIFEEYGIIYRVFYTRNIHFINLTLYT